jgi:tetratricopeptide (TPR) repeat protein
MKIGCKAGAWLAVLAMLTGSAATAAAAEDILAQAKAHYESAAYEQALETLAGVAGMSGVNRVELEQYRAMCLLALGRMEEAADAVAAIVAADPRYVPPPSVASPKVLTLVATVRAEHLPIVIRDLVASGRAAFEEKQFEEAAGEFALALTLIDDEAVKDWEDREAVRVLAEGFATLADASAREGTPPATAAALGEAPQDDAGSSSPAAGNGSAEDAAEASASAPEEVVADAIVQPPVAIHQEMPPWVPPDALVGSRTYHGLLKVAIGVDGRVKEAKMEQPTHPAYDARLVTAARQWVFRPATRSGTPIESEQVIAVQLHPRQ